MELTKKIADNGKNAAYALFILLAALMAVFTGKRCITVLTITDGRFHGKIPFLLNITGGLKLRYRLEQKAAGTKKALLK